MNPLARVARNALSRPAEALRSKAGPRTIDLLTRANDKVEIASTAVAARATRANATTALAGAGLLVLLGAGAAAAVGTTGGGETHITIHFTRAVGLYNGSEVRMLGVQVGKIDKITAQGTTVAVQVHVDAGIKVPAGATASVIPPALVSDRYIQLSVYQGGAVMADHADIPVADTQIPVEKDDIEADLNKVDHRPRPQRRQQERAHSPT